MNQKKQIAAQLKNIELDFSAYGTLPIREDVLLFVPKNEEQKKSQAILKLWEKLRYLRNHMRALDEYLKKNTGETISEWRKKHNAGFSAKVLEAIGPYNNSTGGISAYFFNMQNFFDEQEELYDKMESEATLPADCEVTIPRLREQRKHKRKSRRIIRKDKVRKLKQDGKGYLEVHLGDEAEVKPTEEKLSADAAEIKAEETKVEEATAAIVKKTSNIGVWIAGTVIFVAAVVAIAAVSSSEK